MQASYGKYAAPYVDKSMQFSKQVLTDKVVPAAGAVVGSALSVWDAANDTRSRLAAGKGFACRMPRSTQEGRQVRRAVLQEVRRKLASSTRRSAASAPVA